MKHKCQRQLPKETKRLDEGLSHLKNPRENNKTKQKTQTNQWSVSLEIIIQNFNPGKSHTLENRFIYSKAVSRRVLRHKLKQDVCLWLVQISSSSRHTGWAFSCTAEESGSRGWESPIPKPDQQGSQEKAPTYTGTYFFMETFASSSMLNIQEVNFMVGFRELNYWWDFCYWVIFTTL